MKQRIGKFQLKKVLGKGASGTVYLAVDTFSGAEIALKLIDSAALPDRDLEQTRTQQFLNEASLAGKLHHPHIAAILEAVISENSGYIALEYVPGGDLTQYASATRLLPPMQAIEIAFKCCGALDYAFRQGVVHRDLKPANIMVVSGTNIKISDFGAAYLYKTDATQIADIGSPLYMSPEQVSSKPLDHHSDMFALGVVLYELFTGHRPFTGRTMPELFRQILSEDPTAPSRLRPGLGEEVDRILLRMLSKEPAGRYPSWAEAALELAGAGRLSRYDQGISDMEKFSALRKVPILERMNDSEIWELAYVGRWKLVPPRQVIVREDEFGASLFFLGSGEAKVTKRHRLLNVLRPGEYFGDMAYIKAGAIPRTATIESISEVLLAEFEPTLLGQTSKNCQLQLMFALTDLLVDRLAMADERLAHAGG